MASPRDRQYMTHDNTKAVERDYNVCCQTYPATFSHPQGGFKALQLQMSNTSYGNQTWQLNIHHLYMIFPYFSHLDFHLFMFFIATFDQSEFRDL